MVEAFVPSNYPIFSCNFRQRLHGKIITETDRPMIRFECLVSGCP